MKSRVGSVAQLLFIDLLGSFATYPIWWYTRGLSRVVAGVRHSLRYRSQQYALRIWIKNFFVPMYGAYDWSGRIISVFMRFFVILGRSIALTIEALIYFVGVLLWIVAPPLFLILTLQSGFFGLFTDAPRVPVEIPEL